MTDHAAQAGALRTSEVAAVIRRERLVLVLRRIEPRERLIALVRELEDAAVRAAILAAVRSA
jgi:hypothetical protein